MSSDLIKLQKLLAFQRVEVAQLTEAVEKFNLLRAGYDNTAFIGDGIACDKYRNDLHVALDIMLDQIGVAMSLTREIIELRHKINTAPNG